MEYALQETAYFFGSAGNAVWNGLRKTGQHLADHVIPHHRNNYHPHLLGHRTLALFSLLLVTVKVAVIALGIFQTPTSYASAITEANIIKLANLSREQYGLKALTENSQLAAAAQAKANDMLARQYFAHNTPTGETPWAFIKNAGYTYVTAGENLAVHFTEAEDVEEAWMNSPGHRANILNKNYEEIGIGISQGVFEDHPTIFVVQMFGTPAEQEIAVATAPTKVEQPAPSPAPAPKSLGKTVRAAEPVPSPVMAQPAAAKPVAPASIPASSPAPVPSIPAEILKITDSSVKMSGDSVLVSAATSSVASKVIAQFGELAAMLDPKENNIWEASIPLSKVAGESGPVVIKAYDTAGNEVERQLESFSNSTVDNFSPSSPAAANGPSAPQTAKAKTAHVFGSDINVKDFETKFYLIFISGILAALILAIGIKRHIQHVGLIANSSFVAVFALMLWMAG